MATRVRHEPGLAGQPLLNLKPSQLNPVSTDSKLTVVLFGEVLMDVFPDRTTLGGAPFNVACHLRAFGLDPVLVTRAGSDIHRERILQAMESRGMDTVGVQEDERHPTGQVAVHLKEDGSHQFEILDYQAYDFIDPVLARLIGLNVQPKLMYFGTLAQRHEISRRALSSLLDSVRTPRLLDLNLRKPWYDAQTLKRSMERADIVKLNDTELETLARTLRLRINDEKEQAAEMIRRFKLDSMLVTRGEHGAWLLDKQGKYLQTAVRQSDIKVQDTVGAGDAFAAVFIVGRLLGWPLAQTLQRANDFAVTICGIHGAIPQQQDFYSEFLLAWNLAETIQ
jgi:fructokinase